MRLASQQPSQQLSSQASPTTHLFKLVRHVLQLLRLRQHRPHLLVQLLLVHPLRQLLIQPSQPLRLLRVGRVQGTLS